MPNDASPPTERAPHVQLGQHPAATHLLVHLSDTHFLAEAAPLYGSVDTDSTVVRALAQIDRLGLRPDALVFTGDIADRGQPDAYRRIRALVDTAATRWGSAVVWVMGNHDDRAAFRADLLGRPAEGKAVSTGPNTPPAPVDSSVTVNGLRLIALDTSVPGYHHGELTDAQLGWLARQLQEPAPHGTILALHHPPIASPIGLMTVLELREQHRLARVVAGSDIRSILGGHLHYGTHGLFAGIPVSVAAATCYTMDLTAPHRQLTGVNGGQSLHLVHVYAPSTGGGIVHSQVPIGDFTTVTHLDAALLARIEALSPAGRLDAFSRQR
ncbi:phosphodiesterase [Cryobacterium melibiosiphilum]|uniref:Phosphodiesterase n=1 Tax=Cryobacterium melibiosiphilum TaxID=995039 RepID=A0A3A5MBH8_9MICO|nr:metallophosphoesterase [Cryobacterium melibiosiphilum]RJT84659.1 phosphodiesterase [Cryobacterium melibiosiphilum]